MFFSRNVTIARAIAKIIFPHYTSGRDVEAMMKSFDKLRVKGENDIESVFNIIRAQKVNEISRELRRRGVFPHFILIRILTFVKKNNNLNQLVVHLNSYLADVDCVLVYAKPLGGFVLGVLATMLTFFIQSQFSPSNNGH